MKFQTIHIYVFTADTLCVKWNKIIKNMTQYKDKIELKSKESFSKSFTIPQNVLPFCKKDNFNVETNDDGFINIIISK